MAVETGRLTDEAELMGFQENERLMSALELLDERAEGVGLGVVVVTHERKRFVLANSALDVPEDEEEEIEGCEAIATLGQGSSFQSVQIVAAFGDAPPVGMKRYRIIEAALNVLAFFDDAEPRSRGIV